MSIHSRITHHLLHAPPPTPPPPHTSPCSYFTTFPKQPHTHTHTCAGYVFASLNSCLVLDDGVTAQQCYDGTGSCPPGTIYRDLQLSTIETQLATSLVVLGAWLGCAVGSRPSELYGRRKTLLVNNIAFLIGGVLTAVGEKNCLFLGRFVAGFGVGLESVVVPVLLAEISEPSTRGLITIVHQVQLTLAIFLVSLVSYGFVTTVNHGWQYVQAGTCIPSLIMLVCMAYIPESPKWLLRQGLKTEAEITMQKLRPPGYDISSEIDTIVRETRGAENTSGGGEVTWKEVFACKKAVIIGCGLTFFQAMTGINSVIFYSTTIFSFAGFSEGILATASVGVVNFLVACLAAYLVDKMGRKILVLGGTYLMLGSLIVLSSVLISNGGSESGIVAVLSIITFIIGFSIGLGAVTWVILSEIMPTRLRTKAISLFLSISWGCNLAIGLSTLSLIDFLGGVESCDTDDCIQTSQKHGVAYLYYVFAAVTMICLFFIHLLVPETRGKTPEELMAEDPSQSMTTPLLYTGADENALQ